MEETTVLLFLSLVMLVGSYLAGSIPLVMSLSESKIQLFSVFGAGLLVGTALAVIIPEGIRSLFPTGAARATTSTEDIEDLYSLIGVSLVLGFVVMLLIDQCSTSRSRGNLNYQPLSEALLPNSDVEVANVAGGARITATIGLVVHAAVDGVALGAAATTTHTDVEMIVFIAIMLHKAPAAFGLVTFLMHEGIDRKRIRRHLLVFSLAAPLLAVITYFGIGKFQVITFSFPDCVKKFILVHLLKKKSVKSPRVEGKETLSSVNATGIAMLFSAGTFLYVATVHVLPELTARVGGAFRVNQLFVLVLGAMLPLILTVGHHH